MIKICFYSLNAYPVLAKTGDTGFGGAEVKQVYLAKALQQNGYEVSFITRDYGQPKICTKEEIRIIRLCPKYVLAKKASFYWLLFYIWKALRTADADYYCQRASGGITGIIALFCKIYKKKFIYFVASSQDVDGNYLKESCIRNRLLYRFGLRNSSLIISQTMELKKVLLKKHGLNSILIKDGHPIPDHIIPAHQRQYMLFIGAIRRVKRPKLFIELAKRIPTQQFVMIGGPLGDPVYYNKIENDASGVSNIRFLGHVERKEIKHYLSKAIALINTSGREGLPNTVTEAWSNGVPVIGLNINPDGLLDGRLGYHCEGDFEKLVNLCKDIKENEKLYRDLCASCRKYAVENHDIGKLKNHYLKILKAE